MLLYFLTQEQCQDSGYHFVYIDSLEEHKLITDGLKEIPGKRKTPFTNFG